MTARRAAIYGAIAVAIALAMGLSVHNGFVYDDIPAILKNTRVTDPAQWHTIPRAPYWLGTLWRPFTVAMYALQWTISHGSPGFFHFVSLLIYFAVAVVLLRLLERLGVSEGIAAGAAILFVVHPVHVEAVANTVGQSELWVALMLLGVVSLYVHARTRGTEGRALMPLLALVALAIMSKEQGFVAPLLLIGAEWLLFSDRAEPMRARIRLILPVAALAILLFVIRGILLDDAVGETPAVALRMLSPFGRAVTFLGIVPEWLRLIAWPVHLQADYGPPGIPIGDAMTPRHWFGLAIVIGSIVLFVRTRRSAPIVAFGLFWAAVALGPVSNLITPSGLVMAERVLFVPSIGVAIAAAALIARYASEPAQLRTVAVVAVIWGSMLGVRSVRRVPTWSSQERFFTDITVDGAEAYRGWKVAAEYWDDQHDRPRAIADLKHSIDLWPHDYEVAERLGQIYRQDGHCDQAIPVFTAGLHEDSSATSLRAKLVECLITAKDFDGADRVALAGVTLGYKEFEPMRARVAKLRASSAIP